MKNLYVAIAGICLSVASGYAKIPLNLLPTEKEKVAFLNEADDFIDDMAEGLQDRQCDAVLHAMRGQTGELANVRMSHDSVVKVPDSVESLDIVGDGSARGMKMRLYRPRTASSKGDLPLLVYFHGGGWAFGSLNSCSAFCSAVAAAGEAMVLAVDYSLAPENPFPSGLLDCVAAVEYARDHVAEWGGGSISLGGDSAGGNLAVATALYMMDQADPVALKSLVLFYPVVKAYADGSSSWKEYSRGYGLDSRLMNAFNEAYLNSVSGSGDATAGNADARNPLVSPAEAGTDKLSKLPPVLIIGAERDILYDQGREFAGTLKKCGNDVEHISFPGAIHLFMTVEGQPTAFSKAVALTSAFLDNI